MEKDPNTWQHCDDYCEALKVVNALTVTNDHAERGIALIQEYNRILTHCEEQKLLRRNTRVATRVSASRCSEQEKDEMSSLKRSLFNENSRRNQ